MKYFVKEFETRYFAGIEFPDGVNIPNGDADRISEIWDDFFQTDLDSIQDKKQPNHYIGLEIYPFDFKDTKTFYYYALVETKGLIEPEEGLVTKKLKKGKYICFPIEFDNIRQEIQKVYKFIQEKKIKIHMAFDYEDYLPEENYNASGAILNFCLLMEPDAE